MPDTLDTKTQIALSLKRQMARKPLNKITIKDIVDDCGVNRQTFYYHFEDIYDCLEWMYHKESLRIVEEHKDLEHWQEGVYAILQYIQDNSVECLNALHSMGQEQLRHFFYEDFFYLYSGLFKSISTGIDENFLDFTANVFVYGAAGYILHWLESGMKETPEQIVQWLTILLDGNVQNIFTNYNRLNNPDQQ